MWIAFIVIVLGVLLVCAEIFFLTGTIVPGIAGIVLVMSGIWFFSEGDLMRGALAFICIAFIITVICVVAHFTGHLARAWRRFSLHSEQKNDEGYVAPNPEYKNYLNKNGQALTVLRPAGTAIIDGDRLDVVTEGDYIQQGETVRVVAVEGVRIVVSAVRQEPRV